MNVLRWFLGDTPLKGLLGSDRDDPPVYPPEPRTYYCSSCGDPQAEQARWAGFSWTTGLPMVTTFVVCPAAGNWLRANPEFIAPGEEVGIAREHDFPVIFGGTQHRPLRPDEIDLVPTAYRQTASMRLGL